MNAMPASTRFHRLMVADITPETLGAICLALRVPDDLRDAFAFTPGQYLTLRAMIGGAEVRRCYSLCSLPGEALLRVGVKRVPGGAFSNWAADNLRPGDTLEAMAPEGRFTLPPGADRRVLGIAAGSGITPIISILRAVLEREPGSEAVLLYGNQRMDGIMFRAALEDLKDRFLARFTVVHVLSGEKHELAALHGRLDAARIAALLPGLVAPAALDAAFLCGPDGLAESATSALAGLGVMPERIHVERFTPVGGTTAPPRASPTASATQAASATLTVVSEGVTRDVAMQPGETVLEAGLRAGLDLPWSCRGGMCCTCRARVTDGAVAMDTNYSLQPWEMEAGFVLTCQSRPTTAHVTVDYDAH